MASGLSKQLHMAPAGALSDFRLPPGGAATWIHVISGRKASIHQHRTIEKSKTGLVPTYTTHEVHDCEENKPVMQVYILLPGTKSNLGVYVSWYRSRARQAGVFLPDHTSGALKVSVNAGDTLFIPGRVAALLLACLCASMDLAACSTPSLGSLLSSHVRGCLQLDGCMLRWPQRTLWHCAATTCT